MAQPGPRVPAGPAGVEARNGPALRRSHEVPVRARKVVILACFTDLPMGAISKQIGETEARAEKLLEAGLARSARP